MPNYIHILYVPVYVTHMWYDIYIYINLSHDTTSFNKIFTAFCGQIKKVFTQENSKTIQRKFDTNPFVI